MSEILKENKEIDYTKKGLDELKSSVIDQKLNTLDTPKSVANILDLLKNKPDGTKTNMYQKLESIEGVEFNIEKFAKDIDITVKKFLYQSFIDGKGEIKVNDDVVNSMSVGIQFAMMQTLTDVGDKGSDFFSSFSDLKVEDSGNILNGLMDVFSSGKGIFNKVGNVNKFYKLANRFQNCVSYISYHSGEGKEFGDGSKINELVNGNKFRKILDNPIWETSEGLMSKKSSELGFTSFGELESEMSENDKLELQNIADNVDMPIDLKTINSIKKAIPTAQNLLEKRFTYKSNISGLIDKVSGILEINLMGFGTIGSLLGIKNPIDFLRSKRGEKKGILDFILTGMGFQGGLEGLHREYVRKNIDDNLDSEDKKELISDMYKYYNKEKNSEYKGQNTIDKLGMSKMDEGFKAIIPNQYDVLKKSLTENLDGNESKINPNILLKMGFSKENFKQEKFVDANGNEKSRLVIDETKFDTTKIDDNFVDKYLSDNIKSLASDEKFMKDISNSDQFVLSLMGNLVAGSWFIEGVVIGEEVVDNYLVGSNIESSIENTEKADGDGEVEFTGGDAEILGKIETELKKYNSPIKAEDVLGSSKFYGVPVEYIMAFMKNDSSYATAGKGARTNNPGNIGNDDAGNEKNYDNLKAGVYALGKHLKRRMNEYQKVYGLVLIPTAKQLADNIGPDGKGFLSSQENYKKSNPERKGAYMTLKTGGNNVESLVEDLTDFGITNYNQIA